ncbi:tripartite tricarboxylate transporter TctB family protein [Anaerotalea alkaliphila]|uniref:Tripartite tricarboxylate transporter TctB family protein n=1 Tax=Anaerotalea alkaliphila TaxID=2662126 RepID=A0A7X5HWA3_9FIRM|nr:tripartite tricarboxylate transporter TctB family protein [Anaerotalea alkaliphila]NDL67810.1 tripartite tricarboxylate transporter TctB family protein [Anaerotalea alkaliphila]
MKRDKIVGIGAVLTAVFFFYHTTAIRIPVNLAEPGPRLMPYLAEALMALCGIGMIVESEMKKEEDKPYLTKEGWKRLGIIFGVLSAYTMGLVVLGFLWVTPFMLFVLIGMLSGEQKVPRVKKAVISVAVTFALYFVFAKGFSVGLPAGMF